MKPLHLTAAAAVLLVAALVAFMAMPSSEHAGARRRNGDVGTRGAGSHANASGDAPGGIEAAGTGSTAPEAPPDEAEEGPISITLRILCPDDAPASGADVVLDRGIDALRAKADPMGLLIVQDLARGAYDLRARHGNLGGAIRFETKGALDLGTLRLTAVVRVTGHVYDPHGAPVPNALVEARLAVEREPLRVPNAVLRVPQPEEIVARAASGAGGAYELLLPTGESYALRATARGLAAKNREPALLATDASGIDFHLAVGLPIEGRIVDATQTPVTGARVLLRDGITVNRAALFDAASMVGLDTSHSRAEALSGADGSFSIASEPGVARLLAVQSAGHVRHQQAVAAPATGIVVVLREGVSLRLQAVEAGRTRTPAAHVNAAATYPGGFAAGETDDEGRLLLENLPLHAGASRGQRLHLWGGGYLPLEIDLGRAQAADGVIDLGVVMLTRGGIVQGRVLDRTTGAPIGGARVGAFGSPAGGFVESSMACGTSAQDGSFRLEGVPLDAHTLTATHERYVDEAVPLSGGDPGGPRLFQGSREITLDVVLVPAESIAGVVVAPDGSPVADADVIAASGVGSTALLLGRRPAAKSDAKGRFALGPFRRGQMLKLRASHADYRESDVVSVAAGMGESPTLRLAEPLILEGNVADPGGAPIEGVRVEAAPRTGVTDAAGRYVVRNVREGMLNVAFEHPSYHSATLKVKVDRSLDLGRTVLVPGGTIAGKVVRGDGDPAAHVVVHATREGPAPGRTGASAVTDAKGAFEIQGLAVGGYKLRTREGDAWSAEATARTGTRDVRIVLLRAGKLVGRVTDRGAAVAGATVRAEEPGFLGWARTAADGTFEILSVPPETPFAVVIAHDDFATLRTPHVRASDRPQVFALEPGAEVSGHVVDGRGAPVAGAEVEVRVDGRAARRIRTDARGGFEATGLDDGTIAVRVAAPDAVPTGWIDVAPGSRDVRLVAAEGASISGVVRQAAGRPARQVSVQAIDGEGRAAATAWVWRDDGSFELRGLAAGTYAVRAEQPGTDASGAVAEVSAGATGVEIRLDR